MSKFIRKKLQSNTYENDYHSHSYGQGYPEFSATKDDDVLIGDVLSDINQDSFLTYAIEELAKVEYKLNLINQLKDKQQYLKSRHKALSTLISKLQINSVESLPKDVVNTTQVENTAEKGSDNIENVNTRLGDFTNE